MNKINKTQEIRTFVEREGGLDGRVRAFVRSCVRARVRACVPACVHGNDDECVGTLSLTDRVPDALFPPEPNGLPDCEDAQCEIATIKIN